MSCPFHPDLHNITQKNITAHESLLSKDNPIGALIKGTQMRAKIPHMQVIFSEKQHFFNDFSKNIPISFAQLRLDLIDYGYQKIDMFYAGLDKSQENDTYHRAIKEAWHHGVTACHNSLIGLAHTPLYDTEYNYYRHEAKKNIMSRLKINMNTENWLIAHTAELFFDNMPELQAREVTGVNHRIGCLGAASVPSLFEFMARLMDTHYRASNSGRLEGTIQKVKAKVLLFGWKKHINDRKKIEQDSGIGRV